MTIDCCCCCCCFRSDLGKSLNTDEAIVLGAVYQGAGYTKLFRIKKFIVKEGAAYPIQVGLVIVKEGAAYPIQVGLGLVSRAPDSFGKESGNFSRVSMCQCRNVDTTI